MIVTTRFPDLPPLPETPHNAGFRRRFFSRWGRESSVFVASTRRAAYGPIPTALSFKTVLEGRATLTLGRRRLLLEPGHFLLVNAGEHYSVDIDSPTPVHCFSVHFKPELAADVAASQGRGWAAALEGLDSPGGLPQWREALRPLDVDLQAFVARLVTRVAGSDEGPPQGMALEQSLVLLLQAMLEREQRQRSEALQALHSVRAATRHELLRRVDWASDYILSAYAGPITLDDIAAAAHLSKYHLLRAFHQVKRCTPHQFLQARRVQVARGLLAVQSLDLESVAEATGFGSRWSLQRALRRHYGASGARLRETRAADDAGRLIPPAAPPEGG